MREATNLGSDIALEDVAVHQQNLEIEAVANFGRDAVLQLVIRELEMDEGLALG